MRILLIAYDNGMYINYFPLGLAYVAAKMRDDGNDVEIYHQDVYHYPESHLTQYLTDNDYDVVGVGMCAGYYQYAKLRAIFRAVERAAMPLLVGGHLVSPEPEYFKSSDGFGMEPYVGEYDYKENVDEISEPAWDLFPIDYYSLLRSPHSSNSDRCFPVLSGRGCPYRCNFCYRMSEGYRPRSIAGITQEIRSLAVDHHITYIEFADELLMVNPDRTMQICEAMKPLKMKWNCNGRLNIAKPKVLKAMKDSGCVFINYGIESVDDEVLERMNKKLTVKQIISGVEATLEAGITPGLNMLWGNIGDTVHTLNEAVHFLLKYDDHTQMRTIRPVTPYPGCDLYYEAIKQGKLEGVADFYEKHTNSDLLTVNFTELSDDEFHKQLYKANKLLISEYYYQERTTTYKRAKALYGGDTSFRGFRQT